MCFTNISFEQRDKLAGQGKFISTTDGVCCKMDEFKYSVVGQIINVDADVEQEFKTYVKRSKRIESFFADNVHVGGRKIR